jgi:hypothetical protein
MVGVIQQALRVTVAAGGDSQPEPYVTLIAAVVALVVAGMALFGVFLTVRTSERQFRTKQVLDQRNFDDRYELEHVKELRERYTTCAGQLAHPNPAVRQAGVYALAALADDWNNWGNRNQQLSHADSSSIHDEARACLDLICAFMRASRDPADLEVRQSLVSVIRHHLEKWPGYSYDLRGVILRDADLSAMNLTRTDFGGADLNGANLAHADLTGAILANADLTGANLAGAQLGGADLTGVIHDERTRWPRGTTPPASRPAGTPNPAATNK